MNYGISVLFRAIPLAMALFCMGYGAFVLDGGLMYRYLAAPVLLALGMICVALFCTAAVIIRQLIHTFGFWSGIVFPVVGYSAGGLTFVNGYLLLSISPLPEIFVAGHVMMGIGMVTCCVATVATVSTRFRLIAVNSANVGHVPPKGAFTRAQGHVFVWLTALFAFICWWMAYLLLRCAASDNGCYVAGHVMAGLACICTSLVALVVSLVSQIRNTYTERDRIWWPRWVWLCAALAACWGLGVLWEEGNTPKGAIGYVLIALGLVCFSISSKVFLLAETWRREFPLAARVPLIPVFAALACFMLSAFLFEQSDADAFYFVPARVVAGLGAVCFTLFSIVSILESGIRKA